MTECIGLSPIHYAASTLHNAHCAHKGFSVSAHYRGAPTIRADEAGQTVAPGPVRAPSLEREWPLPCLSRAEQVSLMGMRALCLAALVEQSRSVSMEFDRAVFRLFNER